MTDEQKRKVIEFRDIIIDVFASTKTVDELRESGVIAFSKHSLVRVRDRLIAEEKKRLEKVNALLSELDMDCGIKEFEKEIRSSKFQDEILEVLISSVKLDNFFEWKAYPDVTFKFKGLFRNVYEIGVAIALSLEDSIIVTITLESIRTNVAESIKVVKKR